MWSIASDTLLAPGDTPVLGHFSCAHTLEPAGDGVFIDVAVGEPAALVKISLGRPLATRFTACFRYEPFWMRPAVTGDAALIPGETQVLFGRLADGRIAVFAPLIAGNVRCSLEGSPGGELLLVAESGNGSIACPGGSVFLGVQPVGERDVYAFLAGCAAAVARRLGIPLRKEKTLPAFAEQFGWCTWDAFYTEVSAEKVCDGLRTLGAAGIPPKFLILDDGWQSTYRRNDDEGPRLSAFRANSEFQPDLASLVRTAKKEFGVEHFLVWHTLQGCWGGVGVEHFPQYHPKEISRAFSAGVLGHFPEGNSQWWGRSAGIVPAEQLQQFLDDYHRSLAAQEVDGVKVDNQATQEAFAASSGGSRVQLYAAGRAALEASAGRHFRGNLIHCMSCVNDLLYQDGATCLTRTSTDFWPGKPETHGVHLWTNALVALWFGHFIHPDWDMFQSALSAPHQGWSEFHAAARAISGGPVYVSDKPGEHNPGLVRKLMGAGGRVLRCPEPGVIAGESLFCDPSQEPVALKIINGIPGDPARGVVGVFNCRYGAEGQASLSPVQAQFSSSDVPALAVAGRYAVYLHCERRLLTLAAGEAVWVLLEQAAYEIATFCPIQSGFALVGLLEKFNTAAGAEVMSFREGGPVRVFVHDSGRLAAWMERAPLRILGDGGAVPFSFQNNWCIAEIPAAGGYEIHF